MYAIRFDPIRRIFHFELHGFWSIGTVIQFGAELLARTTVARVRHGRYAVLSDSREFPIQSAGVAPYFERIMARGIEMDVGPCAIVVGSHLNKLQAERLFQGGRARVVLDYAEAAAWLDDVWP